MLFDEFLNGGDQLRNVLEGAAADAFVGQFPEPTFDNVQPRAARRREVHVEPRMTRQPTPHLLVFVRGVIVHDQVQVQLRIRLVVDYALVRARTDPWEPWASNRPGPPGRELSQKTSDCSGA